MVETVTARREVGVSGHRVACAVLPGVDEDCRCVCVGEGQLSDPRLSGGPPAPIPVAPRSPLRPPAARSVLVHVAWHGHPRCHFWPPTLAVLTSPETSVPRSLRSDSGRKGSPELCSCPENLCNSLSENRSALLLGRVRTIFSNLPESSLLPTVARSEQPRFKVGFDSQVSGKEIRNSRRRRASARPARVGGWAAVAGACVCGWGQVGGALGAAARASAFGPVAVGSTGGSGRGGAGPAPGFRRQSCSYRGGTG